MDDHLFDPSQRARDKQASRDRDDRALAAGRDAGSLQRENGFIPGEAARAGVIREWTEFN